MKADFKENYSPDLFSWKELEQLINIRPLMNVNRIRFPGNEREKYTWKNDKWTVDPYCYPPSLLKKLINERTFFLISDMTRCTEKVNNFAKKIESDRNLSTDAHIYVCLNPKQDHPFGTHFDTLDVIVVQCEGNTNFKVWDKVEDISQKHHHLELTHPPLIDVNMNPGDVIWIPRYFPHLATSKSKRMSISFCQGTFSNTNFQERDWIRL